MNQKHQPPIWFAHCLDHVTYSKFLVYSSLRDISILKDKWKAKSDPGLSLCKHSQKLSAPL